MKRVIITGATGFVGSNLARRLICDGHEVHALVRQGYAPWRIEELGRDIRIHQVDLGDLDEVSRVVESIRTDWIFHLAVHGAYSTQIDHETMVRTNVLGTINLVEACVRAGFEAFVNTGSSSEYGFKDHAPEETEYVEPNSTYAVTKSSATMYCRHVARSRREHIVTLRLYSVYGPYEEPTRLLPSVIIHGLRGALPPLADPRIARDYIFTDDAIEAFLLAASQPDQEPGAVYNVGTGTQISLDTVVGVARNALGITEDPVWGSMPNRTWDTSIWRADNRKLRRALGWEPSYPFEAGFERMVDWFRASPIRRAYYEERLGLRER